MNINETTEEIIKGTITGVLCAYLVLFGLRPAAPYPELILEVFEHLWMFIILLVINYYIFIWDYDIGVIFLLCIIALIFDFIVFTNKGFKKTVSITSIDNFSNLVDILSDQPEYQKVEKPQSKKDPKDASFYDLIIKDIKYATEQYPGEPALLS